jgi:lipoprotein-anchoring transpeptidase ErfK/SrfK
MQRIILPALLAVLTVTTASAGPLTLEPEFYSRSPDSLPSAAVQAPVGVFASNFGEPSANPAPAPRVTVAQRPNLGGGFLEMLFNPAGQQPAPRYAPAPTYYRGQAEPSPGYESQRQAAHPPVSPEFMKQEVSYDGSETPGTVIINTRERLLYLVMEDGKAIRYGIGVGRPGFTWAGTHQITQKREWPDWTPPPEMLRRRPDLPRHMAGGPDNPLGARAMYLGSSLYRIHGSNEPWTIGTAVSSGCIRMRNEDVVDLYDKVKVGAKVVVI